MIYRGTTPTHLFNFPFEQNEVQLLYISYSQKGSIRVEKTLEDVTFDAVNSLISVQLTQEDTLSFDNCTTFEFLQQSMISIQLRVLLTDGTAWVSEIMTERVGNILKDGIIPALQPQENQNETD